MISRCGHQASLLCMQAKQHATLIPLDTQLEHLQWPHAASGRLTEYGLGDLGMPPCQLASGHAAPGIAHLPPKVHTCCSRPCNVRSSTLCWILNSSIHTVIFVQEWQQRVDTEGRRCTQDMSKTITLILHVFTWCLIDMLGIGLPSPLSLTATADMGI